MSRTEPTAVLEAKATTIDEPRVEDTSVTVEEAQLPVAENETSANTDLGEFEFPFPENSMNGPKSEFIRQFPDYDWSQYTVLGAFREAVEKFENRPLLGTRAKLDVGKFGPYQWHTYRQVASQVDTMRDFLVHIGITAGDMVAIYGRNREEWLIADLACCAVGAITVPLYDALGVDKLLYISKLTELKAAFVDHKHAPLMLSLLDQLPSLKHVVSFDAVAPRTVLASSIALYCERNSVEAHMMAREGSMYSFDAARSDVHSVVDGVPGTPSILSSVDLDIVTLPPNMPNFVHISGQADLNAAGETTALTSWGTALTLGKAAPTVKDVTPASDAPFSVMFSSGTTGNPKGVVTRNIALGVAIEQASGNLGNGLVDHPLPSPTLPDGSPQHDLMLSYLPLAHVFERGVEHMMIHRGDAIGYSCGNVKMLLDDVQALRPTLFIGVPRVFMRIYNGMQAKISSATGLKGKLLRYYMKQRVRAVQRDASTRTFSKPSRVGLALVYNKFRAALGGRCRHIWTGSAPIPGYVLTFFKAAFITEIHEGYGLTETMAVGASTLRHEGTHGHQGVPGVRCRVKLVDVPGRCSAAPTDGSTPQGEVCFKGDFVCREYYKAPELTASAIDSEGWLHTGDIGEAVAVDGVACLRLTGRIKNVLKLQQGEFVNLDAIDAAVRSTLLTAHVTLARGTEPFVIVFCTVDVPACRAEGFLPEDSTDDDLQDPGFRTKLLRHVRGGLDGLRPFEMPRSIHVCDEEWGPDNVMTPSMKIVRSEFEKRFGGVIDEMYRSPLI